MYSGKDVPAVGVSIGVERVFSIMEGQIRARAADEGKRIRATRTQVLVGSFGKGYQVRRACACSGVCGVCGCAGQVFQVLCNLCACYAPPLLQHPHVGHEHACAHATVCTIARARVQ